MLFLLSPIGPSASSCCSRNFLHCQGHHRSPGLWIRLWKGRESQICGHKNSPGGEYPVEGGPLLTTVQDRAVPLLDSESPNRCVTKRCWESGSVWRRIRSLEAREHAHAHAHPVSLWLFPNEYFVMTNYIPFWLCQMEAQYINKFPCVHSLI